MPHLGDVGCMIYELNGIDEGGIRSSMGYASWTKAVVDCVILSLAVSDAIDMASPAMSDFLFRWNKANDDHQPLRRQRLPKLLPQSRRTVPAR